MTLEERNRAEDRDVYKETSFKETNSTKGDYVVNGIRLRFYLALP